MIEPIHLGSLTHDLLGRLDREGRFKDGDVIVCEKCGEPKTIYSANLIDGFEAVLPCAVECACSRKRRIQERAHREMAEREAGRVRAFQFARVSDEHLGFTLDSWGAGSAELLKIGRALVTQFGCSGGEKPGSRIGATISGKRGLGKTQLLYAIANEMIGLGVEVRYVSAPYLFALIRDTYGKQGRGSSENSIIDDLLSGDVLLLDEIGMGKWNEWTYEVLFRVVDGARAEGKVIVAATNLDRQGLKVNLRDPGTDSERLLDRLLERSPFAEVEGLNYRKRLEKESLGRLNQLIIGTPV